MNMNSDLSLIVLSTSWSKRVGIANRRESRGNVANAAALNTQQRARKIQSFGTSKRLLDLRRIDRSH